MLRRTFCRADVRCLRVPCWVTISRLGVRKVMVDYGMLQRQDQSSQLSLDESNTVYLTWSHG